MNQLRAIQGSFLEFLDRTTRFRSEGLQAEDLMAAVCEPFSPWQRLTIEKFGEALQKVCPDNQFDLEAALNAKENYTQAFSRAKAEGLSILDAMAKATLALTPEQRIGKEALEHIIYVMGNLLEGPSITLVRKEADSRATTQSSLGVKGEAIILTQPQIDKILNKLEKAHQQGELSGVAAQTPLPVLEAQVLHHAAHWTPRSINVKTQSERIDVAFHVALKRMRSGQWSAPYGWSRQSSLAREQRAEHEKKSWKIA